MFKNYVEKQARRLSRDTSGHVAIIAALSIIPIVSVAGLAIDFQMTTTKKSKVQHVVDSAVLAGSKSMQAGKSRKEIRTDVRRYVKALTKNEGQGLRCKGAKVKFTKDSQDIEVSVQCWQDTSLSQIMGKEEMEFNVSSTSTYGIGKVDVAFIFDNSGSMNSNNRLSNLKASAREAIDVLLPTDWQTNEDVRIAIVPYSHAVNAGDYFEDVTTEMRRFNVEPSEVVGDIYDSQIVGKVQIDAFDNNRRFFDYETVRCNDWDRGRCDDYTDWAARKRFESTCVFERVGANRYTNALPDDIGNHIGAGSPLWDYDDNYDETDRWWDYRDKERGQTEVESGGADSRTGAFDPKYATCPTTAVAPLTNNRTDLLATVNGMTASSGTAGHQGVAWAYYMISPEWKDIWPSASEPLAWDEPDTIKAIILMTDGAFNNNHPIAGVDSTTQASEICDHIRDNENKNIVVYTIGFQVPDNVPKINGKTILQHCATRPEYAFDASNAQELTDAYTAIASSISDLRIKR